MTTLRGVDAAHEDGRPAARPGPFPRSGPFLGGALLLLFVLVAAEHVHHAVRVAAYPYDLDNGEAFVLNQALYLSRGESPWLPIDEEPYLVSNFAPLYPWIVSFPVRWWGVSFAWGRWLSVIATLGTAVLVGVIVRRLGRSLVAGGLAALLFLSSKFVYDWSGLHRIDALALFFTTTGLAFLVRSRRVGMPGVAFALAILTRQTMVIAPLAAILWLARDRKSDAVRLALLSFVPPALVFLGLNLVTGGQFLTHTLRYNLQPYSWALVGTFASHWVWYHPGFLGAGLLFLMSRTPARSQDLPTIYFGLAMLGFFLCGRVGAASNYMFELVVAFSVAIGCLVAEALRASERGPRLAVLSLLIVQPFAAHLSFRSPDVPPTPNAQDANRGAELARLVRSVEGEVLAEDNGYLLLSGKRIVFEPYIFTQLADSGIWDPTSVRRDIGLARFGLIVLGFDVESMRSVRWEKGIAAAIARRYRLLKRIAGPGGSDHEPSPYENYWVYVPR